MAVHHPGSRAGSGVALKSIRETIVHGGGRSLFATLNVVPMIDLFTMLVIFLIQQFSASGELMLVNPNVAMPKASTMKELERAPIIALTRWDGQDQPGDLLFENTKIISQKEINEVKYPSWDIKPLAEVLKKSWMNQQKANGPSPEKTKQIRENRKIIIQADRTVPFAVVKMVMATCGRNEYREPNFAIMVGQERAGAAP
ncbi:MAG: biopolymer transporter ExbD [Deltaproteobacteria bacterium]|nr:biopolymer transporter ExbD [Deltaproteobacteria bacterium]